MPTLSASVLEPMTTSGSVVTADGRTLPLRTTRLCVRAAGGLAQVHLVQTFANPWAEPLHVTYQLPLPADAAVGGFSFRLGEHRVVGEIDRRAAARERFEQAIASGRTAALLEQDRSSLFRQELGNLPPGAELEATIDIDQPLAWVDDGWQWRFPTTVAPRYLGAPGQVADVQQQQVDVVDPDAIAPGPRCELELLIADVLVPPQPPRSPSHALHTVAVPGGLQVAFVGEHGRVAMDRDVVVHWPVAAPEPGVQLRAGHGQRPAIAAHAFGLLTIVPPATNSPLRSLPRDLIVLLDISGSMNGAPLAQAVQVATELVRTLEAGDRFELVAFASRQEAWRAGPQPATPANKGAAVQWLQGLRASGSTEMHTAIVQALVAARAQAQRQVVVVTDGLIGFEQEVVQTIRSALPELARVHVVGVGSAPNRTLTRGASRAGRGVEVLIGIDESVGPAVARLLARTCAPIVTALELSGTALLAHAPQALPDLFAGAPARLAVQLRPEGGTLHVRGRSAAGPFDHELVVPPVTADEPGLARGFARETAEDLEVELAAGGDARGVEARLEQLGLTHGIATRLTSWIAISDVAAVDPRAVGRREVVPQELPHGMSVAQLGLRRCHAMPPMAAADASQCILGVPPASAAPMSPSPTEARAQDPRRMLGQGAFEKRATEPTPPTRAKAGGFLRRLFGGGQGPADERSVRAVLRLRSAKEWVFELRGLGAWQVPTRVVVVFADGSEREFAVDPARTTLGGPVANGAIVRLVLQAIAGLSVTDVPIRLRVQVGGLTLDVPVA